MSKNDIRWIGAFLLIAGIAIVVTNIIRYIDSGVLSFGIIITLAGSTLCYLSKPITKK